MDNPWNDISLSDYENHMSLDSVQQLQVLNEIMKIQFEAFPFKSAMILGVAGGNGLEHVSKDVFDVVYGVDINEDYLKQTEARYPELCRILKCLKIDLINEAEKLPKAELVIANLLVEYIGLDVFCEVIKRVEPKVASCVIQKNTDEKDWVSESPYLHAFDRLDEVHHQMDEKTFSEYMGKIGYKKASMQRFDLPNGKALIKMDFTNADNVI